MNYRTRFKVARWLGILITISMLVACGSSAEPAIPTREPAPTFTPTAEIQAPGASVDPAVAAAAATAAAQAAATQAAPAEQPTTAPEQVARQLEEVRNTATALRHRIVRDR